MDKIEFLKHFPNFQYQTFDDKGIDQTLARCTSKLTFEQLEELNKKGAGIFFTPNGFPEGQRKQALVHTINAWFCEMDEGTIDEQLEKLNNAPIFPSIVVRTRKSLHCYWLVSGIATRDNWTKIVKGLIYHFNADRSCKDISRVLRVPGYFHNKQEPFLVEVALDNSENRYTEADMLAAYPESPELDLYYLSKTISTKAMLDLLSGDPLVKGEVYSYRNRTPSGQYIDINDKPADAWIDDNGLIGSGKNAGPTWLQWMKYYNLTNQQIKHFLLTKARHLLPDKTSPELSAMDIVDLIQVPKNQEFFTWGVSSLDEQFSPLARGKYVMLVGETGTGKTDFTLQMAIANAKKGFNTMYLSLEMTNAQLLLRHGLKMAGVSKQDYRDGKYNLEHVKAHIRKLPSNLKFHSTVEGFTIKDLSHLLSQNPYDIIFVDNLGFVEAYGANRYDQERNLSKTLKELKDKHDCTIIALHHFNKSDSKKQETGIKVRSVDSVLGNAKFTHDVDFVVQVARDKSLAPDSDPISRAELLVVQQKDRDWGQYASVSVFLVNGKFESVFKRSNLTVDEFYNQSSMLNHFENKNATGGNSERSTGIQDKTWGLDDAFDEISKI